jgi:hypothetical protein
MLYSSVIPFYEREYDADFATHPSYSKLPSLDERNDYAFTVPYRRIIHYSREKLSIEIPSFYIYTEKAWTGTVNISGYFLFEDGSTVALNTNASTLNFVNTIQRINFNNTILLVSLNRTVVLSTGWPLGPVILVLNVFNNEQTYTFYSDRLYITDDIHNYILLSWTNDTDLAIGRRIIPYSYGYNPSVFIDTHIGKPEYAFEEEIVERLGYKFVQSAISKKIYRCAFTAPEYLCDSLRIMRICNNKRVIRYDFPNYGETLEPMVMTMDVNWDEQGHYANVDLSFEVDLVAANPSGYIPLHSGDFNNDYNNDFDNF